MNLLIKEANRLCFSSRSLRSLQRIGISFFGTAGTGSEREKNNKRVVFAEKRQDDTHLFSFDEKNKRFIEKGKEGTSLEKRIKQLFRTVEMAFLPKVHFCSVCALLNTRATQTPWTDDICPIAYGHPCRGCSPLLEAFFPCNLCCMLVSLSFSSDSLGRLLESEQDQLLWLQDWTGWSRMAWDNLVALCLQRISNFRFFCDIYYFDRLVSTHLDSSSRSWRFIAAVALEVSTWLEVLTPLFPKLFIPMAALANMGMSTSMLGDRGLGKNISWLAGSATRAGIRYGFIRASNMSDITAKEGSQSTVSTCVGTLIGICLSPYIVTNRSYVLATSFFLSICSLYCLHKALTYVELPTINSEVFTIVFFDFYF